MENKTGIRPLGPRVVVQLTAVKESVRPSGLVLSQTDAVDTYKADVIVVGDMVKYVAAGDMILLTVGAIQGAIFEHNQEHFAIVFEQDILAVLDRS